MGGGYRKLVFLGSSKGGTCAIYYGLKNNATEIFAGVPQYYIGSYVDTPVHEKVFKSMMGENAGTADRNLLDEIIPQLFTEVNGSSSKIHLLYSRDEHTYPEHIQAMVTDLDRNSIEHIDTVEHFTEHSQIGKYFVPWIKAEIKRIIRDE